MMIDDEADILVESQNGLERQGIRVHTFIDPVKALDHIRNEQCKTCDIVISDIRMPTMTGFEVIRQLNKVRPEMKVILMTELEMTIKEFKKVFPSMRIDDLIKKPFNILDLIHKIRYLYGKIRNQT